MDGRGHQSLNQTPSDEILGRELECALAVDPSPSFVARTRARVERERMRAAGEPRWPLAWAGGAVAVVMTAVWLWPAAQPMPPIVALPDIVLAPRVEGPPPVAPESVPAPEAPVAVAARPEAASPVAGDAPRGQRRPDVVIAPQEARGFELLLADLNQGLLDASMLPEEWGRRAEGSPAVIDVMPIEIEPLVPLTRLEGVRP